MTDDHAGRRRLQPGHWLLIGIVVVLAAAGVAIVVRRGDASPTVTGPTGTPSTTSSSAAPQRADCAPKVTSSWADAKLAKYAFVYGSQCDQVVRELRFRVATVDPAGEEISADDDVAFGGVLFPGTELAVAGDLQVSKDQKIDGLKVQVIDFRDYPLADFSAWAHADVVDLSHGKPGSRGIVEVSGTVRADPAAAPVCVAEFVLIMRDQSNKIVYAAVDTTIGQTLLKPSFEVFPPPAVDFARTKIYAPQTPRTEQPPRAGVPCDGS